MIRTLIVDDLVNANETRAATRDRVEDWLALPINLAEREQYEREHWGLTRDVASEAQRFEDGLTAEDFARAVK